MSKVGEGKEIEASGILSPDEILAANQGNYESLYRAEQAFLRYPADWLIRFHNMYLRSSLPQGARILDYGCGSGNNAIFFIEKGYEVHGVDVAPSFKSLLVKNMALHHVDTKAAEHFSVISPDSIDLDYPDNYFDFIFSNQVLYYLPSLEHLQKVCDGFKRILKPGGLVFFTMMGPRNYYITHHLKSVHANGTVYDVRVEEKGHRLEGVREVVLLAKDERHLCEMFSAFEPLTVGYFDQRMFDLYSNFHWIFAGRKVG